MSRGRKWRLFMDVDCERKTPFTTGSDKTLGARICSKKGCISVDVYARNDGTEFYAVNMHEWGGINYPGGTFRYQIARGTLDETTHNLDHLKEALKRCLSDPATKLETLATIGEVLGDAQMFKAMEPA